MVLKAIHPADVHFAPNFGSFGLPSQNNPEHGKQAAATAHQAAHLLWAGGAGSRPASKKSVARLVLVETLVALHGLKEAGAHYGALQGDVFVELERRNRAG